MVLHFFMSILYKQLKLIHVLQLGIVAFSEIADLKLLPLDLNAFDVINILLFLITSCYIQYNRRLSGFNLF